MGGSSHSLLNLINSLKGKVYPVIIVPQEGKACQEFKRRGIKYYVVPFHLNITQETGIRRILTFAPRFLKDKIVNAIAVKKITQLAKHENIHLIHSNSAVIDFGQKLADYLGIKHIWHVREFLDLDFSLNPIIGWKLFLKKLLKSDTIISVSKSVYNHYQLDKHPNAYVLYNGVRSETHLNAVSPKKPYLLFCGAVAREKGIEDALQAISIIHKIHPEIKLKVVGNVDEPYFTHLTNVISKLGIQSSVDFLGYQPKPDAYMNEALALLMCSKNEAFGRVTVEAMFNCCPVIGNSSGGTIEIVKDCETGYLYSDVQELADKAIHLIEDYENAYDIIKKAKEFVIENFSEEKYAPKLLSIYEKLL